jgi:tRNA(Ile)-lysidine synthase
LSENARELSEFLDKQTEKALEECRMNFGYKTESLLNLDKAVMKNALVMICRKQADFSPEYRHIDLMLEILKNGGAVNLSDNLRAVSKQGIFRLDFAKNKTNNFYEILTDNSDFEFNGRNFKVSKINSDKKNKNSVSADFMNKAEFRTRKAGDKFTYPKRNVTKPLRRVLGEMKIPSEIRDEILVLSIDNIVLWCENIGVSAEGKNNSDEELFIDIF